jgi:hypothetical protein
MATMLASRRRRLLKLRNRKTDPRGRLSYHLSQVLHLPVQIHNLLFLPFLQSQHQLWTQNPPRTTQGDSCPVPHLSQFPLPPRPLRLQPSRRPRTWPILLTHFSMRTFPCPRHLPQNLNSTLVNGAWLLLCMRQNLTRPSPSDPPKHRTPHSLLLPFPLLHRATPRTAAHVRSGAGRHSPLVRSAAASSWARRRCRQGPAWMQRACTMRARSQLLRRLRRPTGGCIAVRSSRWMPCRGSRRLWERPLPKGRWPPPPLPRQNWQRRLNEDKDSFLLFTNHDMTSHRSQSYLYFVVQPLN